MSIKTESTAYVIFFPEEQVFLAGTARRYRVVTDFTEARLFPKESHARNSIATNQYNGIVVPVKTTINPKLLFSAVLKGAPKKNV